MKKKIKTFILIAITIIAIVSCGILPHPDTFMLNETTSSPIEAFKLSDISLVNKTFDNEFKMHRGGICAIKSEYITTNKLEFTIRLYEGNGLRVMTRTDKRKYKTEPGIVFEWTKKGTSFYENGQKLYSTSQFEAIDNFPTKFSFINNAKYYYLITDCDTIYKGTTTLPSTEYFIFESLDAEMKITGISVEELYGFDIKDEIPDIDEQENKHNEETIIIKQ